MIFSALQTHDCCDECRKPVRRCSCEETARTYRGALLRGEWQEISAAAIPTREAVQANVAR